VTSHRATPPSRHSVRLGGLVAVVVGLLLSGVLTWTTSYAAFSATTQNGTNSWATGRVQLDTDPTALFQVDRLWPGATGSRCLTVTSSGSVPGEVRLHGAGLTGPALLTSAIRLDVVQGTGTAADCSDFTPAATSPAFSRTLAAYPTGYTAGGSPWTVAGEPGEQRVYRVSYTVDPNADNATQSLTASMTLVWEVQTRAS
jgi:hypothetical protein